MGKRVVRARVSVSALVGLVPCVALSSHAAGQVNLPPGFEIVEFGFSERLTDVPRINNCGQIVFGKKLNQGDHGWVLHLYDNGRIREITRENKGWLPTADINDHGTIVYMTGIVNDYESERVMMLKDGRTTRLGAGRTPAINNNDVVAAHIFQRMGCQEEINTFLYRDGKRTRLTRNGYFEATVRLNDRDEGTWTQFNFCQNPWVSEIPLYSNGEIMPLPSQGTQRQWSDISNRGEVVWFTEQGIESWQSGVTTVITDELDGGCSVNDLGDVVFSRWDVRDQMLDWWLYRPLNGEPIFYRLTEDPIRDTLGDVNNWTEAVVRTTGWNGPLGGGVRFLRRVRTGDSEFDGDVDRRDYVSLADCLTGPGRANDLCNCRFLDIDHDGDVDLGDFARFQNAFTGG